MPTFGREMHKNSVSTAIWEVVLSYVVFASAWILVSDSVVVFFYKDPAQIATVSTLKGWGFVIVTAILLSVLLRRTIIRQKLVEARLRTLIRTIPDLVWFKDPAGVYLHCNAAIERFFGAKEAEIIGRTDYDFVPSELGDFFRQKDQEATAAGSPTSNEEWLTFAADGHQALVETIKTPLFDLDGKLLGVLGIGRDITAAAEAQQALQARIRAQEKLELQLHEAQKIAHLGFYTLDIGNGFWTSSATLDDIFGIDSIFSRTVAGWLSIIHPDERAEMQTYFLTTVLAEKQTFDREYRIIRQTDQQVRWVHGRGVLEIDPAGDPLSLFGTIQDITESKQSEINLQNRNAEMERFIYTVSHDLKSPLITVKTFLGYLEQDLAKGGGDSVVEDIKYIHTAVDKMEQMLGELLEVSRICRMVNPPTLVTFRELAQEALDLLAGSIASRVVKVALVGAEVTLYGDRPRLLEIWQNLVENAVKYMGGEAEPRIEIGAEVRGPETVFFVADNGIGLEHGDEEKIFGLFLKLDPGSEGSGIGLALVKRIVEMFQGEIWVESAGVGKGCRFSFTLPGALERAEG